MSNRARSLLAGLTALGLLGLVAPARADSIAPPRSYMKVAPGNQFVFVMIVPAPVEAEVKPWNEETAAGIREVRRMYTRAGMYRNDGSTEPLWTVDWYAYSVQLASDGVHLVRPGPWPGLRADKTPDLDWEAVTFFAGGRLLRTYRISELVDHPEQFQCSVSHFRWLKEGRFSGESEYMIATLDGNRFVFDVRTGSIVSESRASRVVGGARWVWWVIGGIVIVGSVCFLAWRVRARARVATAAPGTSRATEGEVK